MKKVFLSVLLSTVFAANLIAQAVDNADFMRSIGKMYVVVAVIITIFIGIVFYLISLDRKLTKLEKEIEND